MNVYEDNKLDPTEVDAIHQKLERRFNELKMKIDEEAKQGPWDRDKYVVQENGGMKDDSGKLRYDLLPPGPIRQLVEILTFGARKYAPNNWQKVDQQRYRDAMMRHYEAWREGEALDPDSGLHHLAHCMCNVMFMLWQETCQPANPMWQAYSDHFQKTCERTLATKDANPDYGGV